MGATSVTTATTAAAGSAASSTGFPTAASDVGSSISRVAGMQQTEDWAVGDGSFEDTWFLDNWWADTEDWPWPDEWTEEGSPVYYEDWEDDDEPQYISAGRASGSNKRSWSSRWSRMP